MSYIVYEFCTMNAFEKFGKINIFVSCSVYVTADKKLI